MRIGFSEADSSYITGEVLTLPEAKPGRRAAASTPGIPERLG